MHRDSNTSRRKRRNLTVSTTISEAKLSYMLPRLVRPHIRNLGSVGKVTVHFVIDRNERKRRVQR